MQTLVTGATGFVGSHVARQLAAAGHAVRVLHRPSSKLSALAGVMFESALGDVTELDALRAAMRGVELVFHVAAVADYWRADVAHMMEVNVEGTRRVLQAAQENGVRRVVFTSSAAAVGLRDDRPADESEPFNLPPKQFPYGYSKAQAEAVAKTFVAQGLDVVIVNPSVVMGAGDLNMISGSFIVQMKRFGRLTPSTSGGLAVIDVQDVARYHLLAAEKGVTGERYILTTANYRYHEWFAMIAQVVGTRPPLFSVPNAVLPLVAGAIDAARALGINTPIDANQVRLGGRNVFFDGRKAWQAFGAPQVDMHDSLQQTYDWYRANGYV